MRICIVSGHTTSGKGTGAKGYSAASRGSSAPW